MVVLELQEKAEEGREEQVEREISALVQISLSLFLKALMKADSR